jgi:hypothetical protein
MTQWAGDSTPTKRALEFRQLTAAVENAAIDSDAQISAPGYRPTHGAVFAPCAIPRSCVSSTTGSTPSAFIIAITIESDSISVMVGSRKLQLMGLPHRRAIASEIILLTSCYSAAIPNGASHSA